MEEKILNNTSSNQNNFTGTNDTNNSQKNESLNATMELNQNGTTKSFQKEIKKKIIKEEIITNVEQLLGGDFQLSSETIAASQQKLDTLNKRFVFLFFTGKTI